MKQCKKCDYLGVDAPCARCGSTRMRRVSSDSPRCLVGRYKDGCMELEREITCGGTPSAEADCSALNGGTK